MSDGSSVLFASAVPEKMDRNLTMPVRFERLLDALPLRESVRGKTVAIKMHLGGGVGYSTIHPLFVKLLVDHIRAGKPKDIFITDGSVTTASDRGYCKQTVGARLVPTMGKDGKDVAARRTGWRYLKTAWIGRSILDADVLVNLSHVKGHGDCGFGGACKNLAMGCVPTKTRRALHGLEGDLTWRKSKCIHCNKCIDECPRGANKFDDAGEYQIFWHHCTLCRHCMLVCPVGAITIRKHDFDRFQEGLARVARLVLNSFDPSNVFHINFLTHITIFCDCWGMTTPALVPDIGVVASQDIVAVETASLKAIKTKNLIPGSLTPPYKLGKGHHLFEKLHGKDPFSQVRSLEKLEAGTSEYKLTKVK